MVGVPRRPEIPVKDFGEAMGVEPALVLPFDAQLFGTAANNGQMISEVSAKSQGGAGHPTSSRQLIAGREAARRRRRSGLSCRACCKRK